MTIVSGSTGPSRRRQRPSVKVVATQLVTPLGPKLSNGPPQLAKLGVLDHISAPLLVVRTSFLFAHTLDPALMKVSLGATLTRFPLFAGRLRVDAQGDYAVALTGAGASFTYATCDISLPELLPPGMDKNGASNDSAGTASGGLFEIPDDSAFLPKVPTTVLGYKNRAKAALISVKLTALAGGGTALGIAVPHLLGDQDTFRQLLKAWAEFYSISLAKKEAKNFDYSEFRDAAVTPPSTAPSAAGAKTHIHGGTALDARAGPNLPSGGVSARFERRGWGFLPGMTGAAIGAAFTAGGPVTLAWHVPAARLAELKTHATASARVINDNSEDFVSTNDALAARIMAALGAATGREKDLQLIVDLRRRLEPPLPTHCLGNCSWTARVPGDTAGSAAAVRAAIRALDGGGEALSELAWLRENFKKGASMPVVFKNFSDTVKASGPLLLSHWNWGGEAAEDLTFGPAPPVWHVPAPFSKLPNLAFVAPAPAAAPGGGAFVVLTLHRKLARALAAATPSL